MDVNVRVLFVPLFEELFFVEFGTDGWFFALAGIVIILLLVAVAILAIGLFGFPLLIDINLVLVVLCKLLYGLLQFILTFLLSFFL